MTRLLLTLLDMMVSNSLSINIFSSLNLARSSFCSLRLRLLLPYTTRD